MQHASKIFYAFIWPTIFFSKKMSPCFYNETGDVNDIHLCIHLSIHIYKKSLYSNYLRVIYFCQNCVSFLHANVRFFNFLFIYLFIFGETSPLSPPTQLVRLWTTMNKSLNNLCFQSIGRRSHGWSTIKLNNIRLKELPEAVSKM